MLSEINSRTMNRLMLLLILIIPIISFSQDPRIDAEKLDSLKQKINHQNNQLRSEQDSFKKKQDSIYYAQMDKRIAKSMQENLEYSRQLEQQHRRQMYIRIAVGTLFLILLILGLIRKRKRD